ncbi:unnamed protein product [Meganyctiphanes norvegica]|uniref:Uncharacterized protein n=1 Tax=Meganyctiphanes norvegica TaxID=48144 RepID=A0AAV2RIM9_MEGNR
MEIFHEHDVKAKQLNSKEECQQFLSLQNISKMDCKNLLQLPNADYQLRLKYLAEDTENLMENNINKQLLEKKLMMDERYSYANQVSTQNVDQFINTDDILKEPFESLVEKFENKRPSRKSAKEARKTWIARHEIEDISNNIRKPKYKPFHPVKKIQIQEGIDSVSPPLPIWAKNLTSVRLVDNAWITGFVSSEKELQEAIEGHCRSILCDYIKSHPCTMKNRHIQRNQSSRLMWKNARVEFDGIPFTINSSDERRCIFAMNYKRKEKIVSKSTKKDDMIEIEQEHPYLTVQGESSQTPVKGFDKSDTKCIPKTRRYKDVNFTDCPAKILIKSIEKYPEYAVPQTSLLPEKKSQLSRLRQDLQIINSTIIKEHLYHITLPLESCHNHSLTGRSRNIHPDIVSKVKEYVNQGCTTPKIIKGLLMAYIESVHENDLISPQKQDRAYYPEVRDIANIIHTHCKKNGIIGKRKSFSGVSCSDIKKRKRLKKKRVSQDDSTTLQEAVETFCKCEPVPSRVGFVEVPDVVSMADMVRSQLDSLRALTYSINQPTELSDIYKSLQNMINHYGQHTITISKDVRQKGSYIDPIALSGMNSHDISVVPDIPDSTNESMNTSKLEAISRQYQSEFTNNGKPIVNDPGKLNDMAATSTLECLAQAGEIHASLSSNIARKTQLKAHNNNYNQISLKQSFVQSAQPVVAGQVLANGVLSPHNVLASDSVPPPHTLSDSAVPPHLNVSANGLPTSQSVPVNGPGLTQNVPVNGMVPPHNISANGLGVPYTGSSTYQGLASTSQESTSGPMQLALQQYVYYVQEVQMPEGQNWAYSNNT